MPPVHRVRGTGVSPHNPLFSQAPRRLAREKYLSSYNKRIKLRCHYEYHTGLE